MSRQRIRPTLSSFDFHINSSLRATLTTTSSTRPRSQPSATAASVRSPALYPTPPMKFTITSYHALATWKWDTSTEPHKLYHYAKSGSGSGNDAGGGVDDDDDEDEDDVCGICRLAYESCCPDCKVPGDDCPLSEPVKFSQPLLSLSSLSSCLITPLCLMTGPDRLRRSMGRMYTHLPHALSTQMDRYGIIEASMSDGPATMG